MRTMRSGTGAIAFVIIAGIGGWAMAHRPADGAAGQDGGSGGQEGWRTEPKWVLVEEEERTYTETALRQEYRLIVGDRSQRVYLGQDPAVYFAEQEGNRTPMSAVNTDFGKGWNLQSGYIWLTGFWRMLQTERTRTITWGTSVVARFVKAGTYNGVDLPVRDQIFVLEGEVVVFPAPTSASKHVVAKAGQYVVAHHEDGMVVLTGPFDIPEQGAAEPPDAEDILNFLEKIGAIVPAGG
jgi:hypothetical protein